jgi:hypothetical protein
MGLWRKVLQAILADDGSPSMYVRLIEQRAPDERPLFASRPADPSRKGQRSGSPLRK